MGIILTMADQMTPVIASSVVMAWLFAAAVPFLFQPRRNDGSPLPEDAIDS